MNALHPALALPMRPIRLTLVLLLFALGGCITPQPGDYQRKFSVTPLAADQFQIDYSGWSSTPAETVADLALLRSAEIALQNGFNYFVVVDGDSATAVAEAPALAAEYIEHRGARYHLAAPAASNRIICFHERPAGTAFVALFVKASLRAKYTLDQAGTGI